MTLLCCARLGEGGRCPHSAIDVRCETPLCDKHLDAFDRMSVVIGEPTARVWVVDGRDAVGL